MKSSYLQFKFTFTLVVINYSNTLLVKQYFTIMGVSYIWINQFCTYIDFMETLIISPPLAASVAGMHFLQL